MDPLSQAVVGALGGAAVALVVRRPDYLRAGLLVGMAGGLVPDLDIVIRSASDPLLGIKYHRHFTHALVMAPLVGAVAAVLAWPVLKLFGKTMPNWRWLWLLATAGVATHGPLDALTNYGTHLFWPFTERRESWNLISIIDPVFTFTLLGLLIAAALQKSLRLIKVGLVFATLYLGLGLIQHNRAVGVAEQLATSRGHSPERIMVNPTLGNQLAWRIVYEADGRMYADGVHLGWRARVYEGNSAPLYQLSPSLLPEGSRQAEQFAYFKFFTNDWMVAADTSGLAIKDARFSALPTEIGGFWGVRLNPANPEQSLSWASFGGRDPGQWPMLKAMILGRNVPTIVGGSGHR
jgi:inner membrane protein